MLSALFAFTFLSTEDSVIAEFWRIQIQPPYITNSGLLGPGQSLTCKRLQTFLPGYESRFVHYMITHKAKIHYKHLHKN